MLLGDKVNSDHAKTDIQKNSSARTNANTNLHIQVKDDLKYKNISNDKNTVGKDEYICDKRSRKR